MAMNRVGSGRYRRPFFSLLACFLLLALSEESPAESLRIYEPAYYWEYPELVSTSSEDLLFAEPGTGLYTSRSFYYTGLSGDGYVYIINIFHWRYIWFDGWGLVALISDFDGNSYIHEGSIAEKDLTESKESLSIRFGSNLFENVGDTSRILLDIGKFRCDLNMLNILPPWKPGDGYAFLSEAKDIYMRKAVPVPLAETSGTISVEDKPISANGWCYGDRSLTVMPPGKLNFTCCAFRVFSQPCSEDADPWILALLDYAAIGKQEGLQIPMLLMAHGTKWILTTKDYQISCENFVYDSGKSFSYPSRINLSAQSHGYFLEGDFLCHRLVHTTDIFAKLPRLLRAIAALFLKRPILFRMIGRFEGNLYNPDGSVESLELTGQGDYTTVR